MTMVSEEEWKEEKKDNLKLYEKQQIKERKCNHGIFPALLQTVFTWSQMQTLFIGFKLLELMYRQSMKA